MRTLRPRDAQGVYAQPRGEVRRLEHRGALHKLAHGYYVVVPQEQTGTGWMPTLEAAAAGIATADFGPANTVLMGLSAARLHGAIPRALGAAVVAVPAQRNTITLVDRAAAVRFVKRDTSRLDAERMNTELGATLVTTPEQTVLDLARRPSLGGAPDEVPGAVRILIARADMKLLEELAASQRAWTSLRRALDWAGRTCRAGHHAP
ncbi:type IV toxin-antitoxin system AbiEi family antitoxin domain-containing protein [Flexivirga oryzae]|uniref:Putative transcriptional regulator of viral defense system n=1 Tax=Flexivirga oryzae TaxID=1794944 RepID=A0A839N640_9MICO|nr:type IV toxin-antitoxin system AbiEi family antitoxin [Flexivirga oryzae]MBB2890221.1 putative transcriptional regulator of viral defense system [Flexivirga oryzae]